VPRADGIDVHAHFFPESFLRLVELEGGPYGGQVDRTLGGPLIGVGGIANAGTPLDSTYWDLDRRVRAMNRQGVQIHALSLTVPMTYWAPPELGVRLPHLHEKAVLVSGPRRDAEPHGTEGERTVRRPESPCPAAAIDVVDGRRECHG
jgi:hypothetical protein